MPLARLSRRVKRVYFYHWVAPGPDADVGLRADRSARPPAARLRRRPLLHPPQPGGQPAVARAGEQCGPSRSRLAAPRSPAPAAATATRSGAAGDGRDDADGLLVAADPRPRDLARHRRRREAALAQANGQIGKYTINFISLDEAGGDATRAPGGRRGGADRDRRHPDHRGDRHARLRRGARRRSRSSTRRASSTSRSGAGYAGFTEPWRPASPTAGTRPARRTFSRLIGDDLAQARALVRAAGAARIVVEAEAGRTPRRSRRGAGAAPRPAPPIADLARPRGAVIYAGTDPVGAAGVAAAWRARRRARASCSPTSWRARASRAASSGAAARAAVFVSSAPRPGSTPELRAFEADFERASAARPGPTPRSGTRRWRPCSPRSRARPRTRGRHAPARDRRVLLGVPVPTAVGPLSVEPVRRGRNRPASRVPRRPRQPRIPGRLDGSGAARRPQAAARDHRAGC